MLFRVTVALYLIKKNLVSVHKKIIWVQVFRLNNCYILKKIHKKTWPFNQLRISISTSLSNLDSTVLIYY